MAGTNKSYWRKKNPGTPTVKTGINSQGEAETYNVWELYQYNPSTNPPVIETAINSQGEAETYNVWDMDAQNYEQGPNRNDTSTTTQQRINSYGEMESYQIRTGTAGFQVNHPNPSISDKF